MRTRKEPSVALRTIEEIEQRELTRCRDITRDNTLTLDE